jgi:hypothetical protein
MIDETNVHSVSPPSLQGRLNKFQFAPFIISVVTENAVTIHEYTYNIELLPPVICMYKLLEETSKNVKNKYIKHALKTQCGGKFENLVM